MRTIKSANELAAQKMTEFLPLCDVLFNVISLAAYFCDVVFDVVMSYALLERGYTGTFAASITIILSSLIISQIVSLRWYFHFRWDNSVKRGINDACDLNRVPRLESNHKGKWNLSGRRKYPTAPVVLHFLQLGVLWRYAKLFVPVDLRYVKHEVRNLCMLRLLHAFCEAAPMLLLQMHVLLSERKNSGSSLTGTAVGSGVESSVLIEYSSQDYQTGSGAASKAFKELNVVSASLSLFSVCWALASFSKNVRLQNMHRLVLTWLGVIFQFAWRLGTISARVTALTVYASLYEHWVFLVIGLHWVSMFLWLISPKNVFHGERISKPRKAYLSALIAFVYVFAYVNLQEVNHRQKMVTFYCVMLVENCLLVFVWMAGVWPRVSWDNQLTDLQLDDGQILPASRLAAVPLLVLGSFSAGIAFMLLYYRYFHVRRLGYDMGGRSPPAYTTTDTVKNGSIMHGGEPVIVGGNGPMNAAPIPGVFNCRFTNPVGGNGATKRKKKKPTSFVPVVPRVPPPRPPPTLGIAGGQPPANHLHRHVHRAPFWRRPLPDHHHGGSSENEGSSVGSRVNIQQKLQEKKQKQLAELRVIEEEIKQGKLANNGPVSLDEIYSSLQRQPIPRAKKHIDIEPLTWAPPSPHMDSLGQSFENLNTLTQQIASQPMKLYDTLQTGNLQNGGYENFASIIQNNPGNFMGPILNGYQSSYMELQGLKSAPNTDYIPGYDNLGNSNQNSSNAHRNMSPSSQISNSDQNNSLTRQILVRTKQNQKHFPRTVQNDRNMFGVANYHNDSGSPRTVMNGQAIAPRSHPYDPQKSISPRTVYGTVDSASGSYPTKMASPQPEHTRTSQLYSESQAQSRQYSDLYGDVHQNQPSLGHVMQNYLTAFIDGSHQSNAANESAQLNCLGGRADLKGFTYQVLTNAKTERCAGNNEHNRRLQRSNTPEILLAPHFLQGCYQWNSSYPRPQECDQSTGQPMLSTNEVLSYSSGDEVGCVIGDDDPANGGRIPSDIDSQISLPRSYTLPREFRYYRRRSGDGRTGVSRHTGRPAPALPLPRKMPTRRTHSNNSSDGDVDSADDNESERLSNDSGRSQGHRQRAEKQKHQSAPLAFTANHIALNLAHQYDLRRQPAHQHSVSQPDDNSSPALKKTKQDGEAVRNDIDADKYQFYGVSPAHGRQIRNRIQQGFVKHETKL